MDFVFFFAFLEETRFGLVFVLDRRVGEPELVGRGKHFPRGFFWAGSLQFELSTLEGIDKSILSSQTGRFRFDDIVSSFTVSISKV